MKGIRNIPVYSHDRTLKFRNLRIIAVLVLVRTHNWTDNNYNRTMPRNSPAPSVVIAKSASSYINSLFSRKTSVASGNTPDADMLPKTTTQISARYQQSSSGSKGIGPALDPELAPKLAPLSNTCSHCSTRNHITSSLRDGSQEDLEWKSLISQRVSRHQHEISGYDGMCEKCSTWYTAKLAHEELEPSQIDGPTADSQLDDSGGEESSTHQRRMNPASGMLSRVTIRTLQPAPARSASRK